LASARTFLARPEVVDRALDDRGHQHVEVGLRAYPRGEQRPQAVGVGLTGQQKTNGSRSLTASARINSTLLAAAEAASAPNCPSDQYSGLWPVAVVTWAP
jgi:hypothetical protein